MAETPRVLALTLARGGSKSVPRKNIQPLAGVPLIAWTILEALRSQRITRYIVSTDDEEIGQIASKYGAEVPFVRPAELASDTASSVSAMQHAVNWAEEQEGSRYDYVVELMCTNPMKTVEDIDGAINLLVEKDADSVIGMHKLEDHHPIRIKKIVDGRIEDFCLPETPETRRQDLKPDAYIRNGSIYALKRDHLMVEGRRYGSQESYAWVMPAWKAVNVDSEMDVHIAEILLQQHPRPYIQAVE